MLFVPKSLLDSSPPQVNPDTRGHSSLPAGKKYKIFPCYGFLTASRKRPACPGVPGASSVVGSSPRAGATVAASPVVGRWAEPAPLPSPFCVCVSFPCRCAERNTPRSALLAKTGAAGRRFRLWFHGTLLVVWLGYCSEQRRYRRLQQLLQNQTQRGARTERLQFLVTLSFQRAHLVVG